MGLGTPAWGGHAVTSHEDSIEMLTLIGTRVERLLEGRNAWTNVYGVARSVLALGTLLTLATSHSTTLFRSASGTLTAPICGGPASISLFCVATSERLELARWCSVVLLVIVASGWRPRITGLIHWYVAYSVMVSSILVDGGDQVTGVLAALLIPVCLTDPRRWQWDRYVTGDNSTWHKKALSLLALSSILVIRLQVAGIYFHAAVAKMAVPEWTDGTAVYYWFTDPRFGLPDWLKPVVVPILQTAIGVSALTWGAMLLEVTLFMGLVVAKPYRKYLLVAGLLFHTGIALVHGLVSFGLAMFGALILYLRPTELEFAHVFNWRLLFSVPRVRFVGRYASTAGSSQA